MDVKAVTDYLSGYPFILTSRCNGAGPAVMDAGHSVKQMGKVGHAGIDSGFCLIVAAIGVGDRYGAVSGDLSDKLHGAGEFGRYIHDFNESAAAVVQFTEGIIVRESQISGILGALPRLTEKRPLHIDSAHGGAFFGFFGMDARCGLIRRPELVERKRQRAGGKGCDAVCGLIPRHLHKTLVAAVAEVGSGIAVGVHIQQSGDHLCSVKVGAVRQFGAENIVKSSVFHGESAGFIAKIFRVYPRVFKVHNLRPSVAVTYSSAYLENRGCRHA